MKALIDAIEARMRDYRNTNPPIVFEDLRELLRLALAEQERIIKELDLLPMQDGIPEWIDRRDAIDIVKGESP